MSRIGKQSINIPAGVTVTSTGTNSLNVKGPKGELDLHYLSPITVEISENKIKVLCPSQEKYDRSLHGLVRSLLNNIVIGVTKGYEKKLEINGVGFRANIQGKKLVLSLGFSHPVEYLIPNGITMELDQEKKNILIIRGIDKQLVGQSAAIVRGFRKPEPYKGKGIRYIDERIIRKAGKTAAKEKTA